MRRHKEKLELALFAAEQGYLHYCAPGDSRARGIYARQEAHPPPVPPRYALPLESEGFFHELAKSIN